MSVVTLIFALGCNLLLSHLFKSFRCAVAIVCLSVFYKLFGIFFVEFKALRLDIRTVWSSYNRTFVPFDSKPVQCIVEILEGFIGIALTVCVLNAEDELSAHRFGEKIIEKCGSYTADVL